MHLNVLFALLATLISISLCFDISDLPDCSILCFVNGLSKTGCAPNDTICQCTTGKQAFAEAATPCLIQQCSAADQNRVAGVAAAICAYAYSVEYGLIPSTTSTSSFKATGTSTLATATGNAAVPVLSPAFGQVVVVAVAVAGGLIA